MKGRVILIRHVKGESGVIRGAISSYTLYALPFRDQKLAT